MNTTMFIYSALPKLVSSLCVVFTLMGRRFDGNKIPNNFSNGVNGSWLLCNWDHIACRREPAGAMYVVFFHSGQVFPDE